MKKFPPKRPDKSHIIIPRQKLEWSNYQKAIFDNIKNGKGHLIVDALAGSAKTSSIVEGFHYIPKGKKSIVFAFNKIIQEELQARAPSYVSALTFHSAGLRAIRLRFGDVDMDDSKVFHIVKDMFPDESNDLIISICDTVGYCKQGLVDLPKKIDILIDEMDVDTLDMPRDEFIRTVIQVLATSKSDTSKVDFNDMCYFPYVYNLFLGLFDYVFVDESQDLNFAQLTMAKKACNPNGGRLIAVGDIFQQIYKWRMADDTIIEEIRNMPTTQALPLPISYRCPKSVIALAQKWVPEITCPDTAIEGNVEEISVNELYKKATPGCFILSRLNAPLIKLCMGFIRRGIKANIRGRDVGKQLAYLIKKSKKKTIPDFLTWLDKWKVEEIKKLSAKNMNIDNVVDRHECLYNICDESKTLAEVVQKTNDLFNDTDEKNIIILSSVHRSKGLETDNVFLLKWTFRAWFDNMEFIEKPNEEANLAYVSCTRCKKNLYIVSKLKGAQI